MFKISDIRSSKLWAIMTYKELLSLQLKSLVYKLKHKKLSHSLHSFMQ